MSEQQDKIIHRRKLDKIRHQKWKQNNPEKFQAKLKQNNEKLKYNPKSAYSHLKVQSRKRQKTLELTFEQFERIVFEPCFYCGSKTERLNGIDRWQNNEGYSLNNSIPCCWKCNRAKNTDEPEQYIEHCKQVAEYWNSKQEL